ncbi:bifunctional DNA-formamidopyrimidine glycosylase/DNA-(apurinic or apyrimidinic site) lyase [Glaciecola sp. MH2013]|uniref:bifunctional DNA-formamidopyrimidine glycosylase/DNA-(apurinic or apyrimidinic site) lyase n=1 Tax=Glaciecola sp. MH2013 TaxID=2785524 RepID=UPI0018A04A99|nr:bifunctional DNA-formamidopyrimidine glycosylase/DNA-(apurinic or apyrimidinic site) lyase [Glaciecola sp. MH2013]MBF7073365.1 bifunctional DNA-formamidopyrimidine glycosylase/DNA-(apurinic or apyrimidinic site) lyase [Glaciecola sp. MH2013]
MPELPEVEVTKLGVAPFLEGNTISKILVHQPQLRWLVPDDIQLSCGQIVRSVTRRAKYLFVNTDPGSMVLHLGMSGKMRVVDIGLPRKKHDHLEIELNTGKKLVLNDARRFGSCLWQAPDQAPLKVLSSLGPEPLTDDFDAKHLFDMSRGKLCPVKSFIMDNSVVVGVGNIYANESLFKSGIDPRRAAGKVSLKRYRLLTQNIKQVLARAIEQGGTTLKDFAQADGNPGYFAQQLLVYGRAGEECDTCKTPIRSKAIGQRNTFFCIKCQK